MDDIYVYLTDLPPRIKEFVVPCADGYTVYIDDKLCESAQYDAYNHALQHIKDRDFEKNDVQEIEWVAHRYGENI